MNNNLIIGLVIAVVLVGGGYYFMNSGMSSQESAPTATEEEAGTTDTEAQAGRVTGSIADLIGRSGSWKCVIDTSTAQGISSGTTYVSGGKVRGDFSSTVEGYGAVESHMIADGDYVYTWTSMMPQGFKMKMTAAPQGSGSGATSGQGVDASAAYAYDCQMWAPDVSVFAVPTTVTFTTTGQ